MTNVMRKTVGTLKDMRID